MLEFYKSPSFEKKKGKKFSLTVTANKNFNEDLIDTLTNLPMYWKCDYGYLNVPLMTLLLPRNDNNLTTN